MAFRKLSFVWPLPTYATPVRLDYIRCFYDGEPISATVSTVYRRDVYRLEKIIITPWTWLWKELYEFLGTWVRNQTQREGEEYESVLNLVLYMEGFLRPLLRMRLKINRIRTIRKVLNTLEWERIGFLDIDFHFSSAIFGL